MAAYTYSDLVSQLGDTRLQYLGYELYSRMPFWAGMDWRQTPKDFSYNVITSLPSVGWKSLAGTGYSDDEVTIAQRKAFLRKFAGQVGIDAYAAESATQQLLGLFRSVATELDRAIHVGNSIDVTIPGALSSKGIDGLTLCANWDVSSDTVHLKYTDASKSWQMSSDGGSSWGTAVALADASDDKVRFPIVSDDAQKYGWIDIDASDCVGLGNLASTQVTIAASNEAPGLQQLVHPDRVVWGDKADIDASGSADSHDAAFSLYLLDKLIRKTNGAIDKGRSAFLVAEKTELEIKSALATASEVRLSEWKGVEFDIDNLSYSGIPIFSSEHLNATHTIGGSSMQEAYLVEFSEDGYQMAYKQGLNYSLGMPMASASMPTDQFGSSLVMPFRVQPVPESSSTSISSWRVDGMVCPVQMNQQKMAAAYGINN